jgi:hypothetical protein
MTEQYLKGQKIKLLHSTDSDPIPDGATGIIRAWHPALKVIEVKWDSPYADRRLNVLVDDDEFMIL